MKLSDNFHTTSTTYSDLPAEMDLVQKMSEASFRKMDLEKMLEICLTGLTELLKGQGAAIITHESDEEWFLHLHFQYKFSKPEITDFISQCENLLKQKIDSPDPLQINRTFVCPPKSGTPTQTLKEWTAIPLQEEDQFLGLLFLDLDGKTTLPPAFHPVIHKLCSGLLSIGTIRQLLMHDPLTGCYNRWHMDVEFSKFCGELGPDNSTFALMAIDIDHFKLINDRYGHAQGDVALVMFSDLLKKSLPKGASAIRLGGDEFLLWAPKIHDEDLKALGQALLENTATSLRLPADPNLEITLSIGLLLHDPSKGNLSKAEMLGRADHALYTSKHNGRNQLTLWKEELENQPWRWSDRVVKCKTCSSTTDERITELELQIKHDQDQLVELLTNILGIKEYETGLHSHRVAQLTQYLLNQLDLPESQKSDILRGAMLHDIGKIALPEAILHKQTPLTETDWLIIKQHPRLGYRFIENLNFLKAAGDIILHHHENFDGSGYPQGLKGKEIPYGARLFSVVDAYDSMRANRVYKSFMPRHLVTAELQRKSGTQFDPEMLEFFLAHVDEIEKIGRWET